MESRTREQMIFEANRKSTAVSYLLWFFLGFLGVHRFYLGRTGTGIAQLVLCLTIIGIIPLAFWWLIDAFLIPGMTDKENMKLIDKLGGQVPPDGRRLTAPRADLHEEPRRSIDPRVEEIRAMRRR